MSKDKSPSKAIIVKPQQPTHAGRAKNEAPPEAEAPHRPFVVPDFSDPE